MVFVQQGFSSNLLVFNSSYFGWLYYGERQFLRFAAYTVHEWKGLSVAGPSALFTNRNNMCVESHCTFTNGKDRVLRVPLHYSQMERTVCCGSPCTKGPCFAGPSALFTNGKDSVLRGPWLYSQMERTVCCESRCTIHKRKGQCIAGPTALFTNGKDSVLRVPSAQGHMDWPQLDLLEDGNGLLMSEAGHRSTVHWEYFIT